ncbi:DNA mismatch repair endonuclease MutL [Fusobacterium sp. PH5-44]|uniref:DNA mismatch repair endonuclease MutL n=1 Tax=unclassified Fusobacterium TaxID=2648384 RepID=UPI003D1A8B88
MGIIKILDESVSNMIAAGEVVENPASMIKELLENSLDANSKNIIIEVNNSGRNVTIKDDGKGMIKEDLLLSVERHATSKISSKDDLFRLSTYGFRGEALSSIAGVSKMTISSKTVDCQIGSIITTLGGKVTSIKEVNMNHGTNIVIKDLFFNTPARLKFLRKMSTEYLHIKDIVMKEALVNYNVSITLILDGKISLKTSGKGLENTVIEIFSLNTIRNSKAFENGYLGNSSLFKNNRDSIFIFVNNRPVKSPLIEKAIIDGYYTKLMKGKYPFVIFFIDIDPDKVDVNVHPSKKIVKFSNETNIFSEVNRKIKEAIEYDDEFISPTPYANFSEDPHNFDNNTENSTNDFDSLIDWSKSKEYTHTPIKTSPFLHDTNSKISSTDKDNYKEDCYNFSTSKDENPQISSSNFNNDYDDSSFHENEGIETFSKDTQSNTLFPVRKENNYEIRESFNDIDGNKALNSSQNIDFKVFGQVFNTFILVERNNIFEIYDQHIIHERILYEELKDYYYNKKIDKQLLLIPLKIHIDIREKSIIMDNFSVFEEFGYDVELINDKEIFIRSVPVMNMRDSTENIFKEILENLKENNDKDIRESIIISMSCRGAIKANEKLTIEEMIDIICRLHEIGKYTCPHGRPIIAKISLEDLEKLFKRKL